MSAYDFSSMTRPELEAHLASFIESINQVINGDSGFNCEGDGYYRYLERNIECIEFALNPEAFKIDFFEDRDDGESDAVVNEDDETLADLNL